MKLMKVNRGYYTPSFSNFFDNFFDTDLATFQGRDMTDSIPTVNVLETKDGFEVAVAAPGISKDDFKMDVEKDMLTISAEVSGESKTEGAEYTRREHSYGSFNRSFTLPDSVDGDKISANYMDGILKISIPKKEEAKVKAKRLIKIS